LQPVCDATPDISGHGDPLAKISEQCILSRPILLVETYMTLRSAISRRCLGVLAAFAAFGLAGFSFDTESSTKGLLAESRTAVTEDLFHLLRAGNFSGSQARLAVGPRKAEPVEAFTKHVQGLGLATVQSVLWTKRSANASGDKSTGELEGLATLLDGRKVPVVAKLSEAGGVWRVVDLAPGKAASAAPASPAPAGTPAVPNGDDLARLVQGTTAAYFESLREKSMAPLHRASSAQFQKSVTLESLDKSFKQAIDGAKVTGNLLNKRRPTMSVPATIDAKGELQTEAFYDFGRTRVTIKQSFIAQNGEWKLFAFNARTADVPAVATGQPPAGGVVKPITPTPPLAPVPVQK
jgi:hypothetical protein